MSCVCIHIFVCIRPVASSFEVGAKISGAKRPKIFCLINYS